MFPPPATVPLAKKMEERRVLNPYCDLNKAIANRASHHHDPIWKRWAEIKEDIWRVPTIFELLNPPRHTTKNVDILYTLYVYLSLEASPNFFDRKQTNPPPSYVCKWVCIILCHNCLNPPPSTPNSPLPFKAKTNFAVNHQFKRMMFLKVDKTQVSQSNVENSFFLLKESSQLNYRIYGPVFFVLFFFSYWCCKKDRWQLYNHSLNFGGQPTQPSLF